MLLYLRTLPSAESEVKTSKAKFPVSLLINTMPVKYASPVKPDRKNPVEYGRNLTTVGGCIECHTPMVKGKPVWEEAFSGGRILPHPEGVLTTSNLTPDSETGNRQLD